MNSILLDTHAFIWLSEDDPQSPISLRDRIEATEEVFVSIASFWEISIKLTLRKMTLRDDFNTVEDRFKATRLQLLPISIQDTIELNKLVLHHRDPFDRIMIAQAINRSFPLASRDSAFDAYPVEKIWS